MLPSGDASIPCPSAIRIGWGLKDENETTELGDAQLASALLLAELKLRSLNSCRSHTRLNLKARILVEFLGLNDQ